ncbi:MAG: FAD:protein FMN transferase [Gammaproteobacteria bacterium]|nr:FAD:protein FMN transferase [Gammaproteobacteria bacterium]
MASPCFVFIDTDNFKEAEKAAHIACDEALRIEKKFSRYRNDNIIHRINTSNGTQLEVDPETALLLDYAALCYRLSEGQFDITSGVLREVWKFDGSDRLANADKVKAVLNRVGWKKVQWSSPLLRLEPEMEIDLGGIGKEYAVDRTAALLTQAGIHHALVNFGGDLVALGTMRDGRPWIVEIESVSVANAAEMQLTRLHIETGALATSGDTHRFLLKDGIRYSHILSPKTGWPVPKAPQSVTVLSQNCLEAGMLATFAMLEGANAENFLANQGVKHWCQRA